MSVINMVVGNTTPDGATFVAKVDGGGPVRVAVSDSASMVSPVFTASQAVDAQGVAKVAISGLAAASEWFWQVEDGGILDTGLTGRFRTHPVLGLPASYTVAVASCAGGPASVPAPAGALAPSQISDHPVFDTIRTRAHDEGWLGFWHIGDLHYYHLGDNEHGIIGSSLANYRRAYDDVLLTRQHQLYRELDWRYVWDDNDFDGNNSDGTFVDKANALQAYGERVPHGTLDDSNGVYQSWQVGRVLFIASDTRYLRSPNTDPDGPSKTMLGSAQKTWMEGVLTSSSAEFFVWLMPSQWIFPGTAEDTWGNFATERDELVQMLGDLGWLGRTAMVYGDRHGLGIDSGGSNLWGGFPIMVASSLDSGTGTDIAGLYDVLDDTQGRNQYGTVGVTDLGNVLAVRLSAWRGTTLLGQHQIGIATDATTVVASGALTRTLSGSHTPTFEARVVIGNPTGDDPEGEIIPILGGDVRYDSTASVFAALELTTAGLDENTGESLFPRHASDLLAPYGAELFIRRGVDLGGGGILWTNLGYFRVETVEQGEAPHDPIAISGSDRMAGIVEARLLERRVYAPDQTVGAVVNELITDVYPDAVIVWDDDTDQQELGRQMIAEQERYQFLHEQLIEPLGKVIFVDGEGVWRIEDAPDPDEIVWEVRSGRDGVALAPSRQVTREGVWNAVVAIGEGATENPARAVAVDKGLQSPTRFGGPFGKVPRFYSSPLIQNSDQALSAALKILRRNLGLTYQVNFGAITNPTLRPRQAIRVTYRDGNREKHIVEVCTIPLIAEAAMSGRTREQTLVSVGSLT